MEGLPTFKNSTLNFDQVILHTVMHHSLTSTYMLNFTEIKKLFVDGRTDVRKDGHLRPTLLGRLKRVDLKTVNSDSHQE